MMCSFTVTAGHDGGGAVAVGVARVHQALLRLPEAAGWQGEHAGCTGLRVLAPDLLHAGW